MCKASRALFRADSGVIAAMQDLDALDVSAAVAEIDRRE